MLIKIERNKYSQISENFLTDCARSLKYSCRISVIICRVELDMECQPTFEHIWATEVAIPRLINSSVIMIFAGNRVTTETRNVFQASRRVVANCALLIVSNDNMFTDYIGHILKTEPVNGKRARRWHDGGTTCKIIARNVEFVSSR